MYTSDTRPMRRPSPQSRPRDELRLPRRQLLRVALAYALVSGLAVLVDRVYALFAHGIASAHMSLMFLFPLAGGALFFGALALLRPRIAQKPLWRAGLNLYSSGIAALTVGSLLDGVFEIAGTASGYTLWFYGFGTALWAAGLLLVLLPGGKHAGGRGAEGET